MGGWAQWKQRMWKANTWLHPSHLGRVNRPAFGTTLLTSDALLPNPTTPTFMMKSSLCYSGVRWPSCLSLSCVNSRAATVSDPIIRACFPPSAGAHSSMSPAGGSGLSDTQLFRPKIPHPLIAPLLSSGTCFFCACVYRPRYIFISGLPERANKSPPNTQIYIYKQRSQARRIYKHSSFYLILCLHCCQ